MSSTKIELMFEGEAVKARKIDASLLAESLSGYSQIYRRANQIANGDASVASVLVESDFKSGSFITGLELVQTVVQGADHLITAYKYLSSDELAALIGFVAQNSNPIMENLIGLWKWLKGKKPENVVRIGDNNVEITFGTKKTVNNITLQMYEDPGVRAAVGHLVIPLRQADIDRIVFRREKQEQGVIEKAEAQSFEVEPLQLTESTVPMGGEREAVLIVSKLSFTEGSTWTFFERGATVVAKIEDEEFWENIHQHTLTFGEGDSLLVRLKWQVVEDNRRKLVAKNTIVKVLHVLPRPVQLTMSERPGRRIRRGREKTE